MRTIKIIVVATQLFFFCLTTQLHSTELRSLDSYLEENETNDPAALIYVSLRCSALYTHAASVTQNRPDISSKFEEVIPELLWVASNVKSTLSNISGMEAFELLQNQFDMMFNAVKSDAEENWAFTGNYMDDRYWSDLEICNSFYNVVSK